MNLGKAVRFVRLSQELSQEQVASEAGLTEGFISAIEVGQREPSWKSLLSICDALHVDLTLLAMLIERDKPFVKPIISLAYNELSRVSHEQEEL